MEGVLFSVQGGVSAICSECFCSPVVRMVSDTPIHPHVQSVKTTARSVRSVSGVCRKKIKKKNGLGWVLRRPGDPLHMPEKGCFNMFQYGFVEVLYICQWAATVETSRNNYLHLGFCVEPQPNSESIHLVGFLSTLLVDSSQARPRCGANHRCSPGTLAVVPMGFAYGMIGGIRILTNMPEPSYPDAPFAMYGRRYRQKYDIFLAIPADPS